MGADFDFGDLPTATASELELIGELATPQPLIRGIHLLSSISPYVSDKRIAAGHYCIPISFKKVFDLGRSIDVLVLACRPKAIDMGDKPVVTSYDSSSGEFLRIKALAKKKGSKCQAGNSFLLYERQAEGFLRAILWSSGLASRIETPC